MNKLLTADRISSSPFPRIRTANPVRLTAPIFFAGEGLAEELVERASESFLDTVPGLTQSPVIDPEEFETVYLWFYS